ncbi:MAG: hypothetical protein J6F30_09085, partial [Cellulosilyticum sp.]|nr:hypothetical protein [Cellulosilyticum sp.]
KTVEPKPEEPQPQEPSELEKIKKQQELMQQAMDEMIIQNPTPDELAELKIQWGEYSPTDLTFLKQHLDELLSVYECSTPIQKALYMNICRSELQARKCLEDGDVNGYEKAVKIVSMLSGDLQIKPANKKDDQAGGSFGVFMAQVEQIMPIPEPLPEFKDVNRIKKYFDVFFVRQIARMLGKSDIPVEEDFNEDWS